MGETKVKAHWEDFLAHTIKHPDPWMRLRLGLSLDSDEAWTAYVSDIDGRARRGPLIPFEARIHGLVEQAYFDYVAPARASRRSATALSRSFLQSSF